MMDDEEEDEHHHSITSTPQITTDYTTAPFQHSHTTTSPQLHFTTTAPPVTTTVTDIWGSCGRQAPPLPSLRSRHGHQSWFLT
ncbi:hypothetical protein E2C01_006565 [Portunus trituberculatus]|uniref:Uncharacterized protein n=1 Tax=Portunus trituberculatus TaxID=210409 RepID=A0A5B7CX72_PORTR|nr:hypothetical protein [Portunus trituberculatus]